jgi:hypothetical protein
MVQEITLKLRDVRQPKMANGTGARALTICAGCEGFDGW